MHYVEHGVDEYWFVLYVNETCLNQNDLYAIFAKKKYQTESVQK